MKKKDHFKDSNKIYIGTHNPWDIISHNEKHEWYGIKIPSEFNWMIWSSAGTYKSKLIQTMIPYFYNKGYYICIIEAKDATLSFNLNKKIMTENIFPEAYNTTVPIVSHIPSYAVSDNLNVSDKIAPKIAKRFNNIVTIHASSITNSLEWATLLKSSETGAEVIHILNRRFNGNIEKMEAQVKKGFFLDDKGRRILIHSSSKASISRVFEKIKVDDFLNSDGCKEINIENVWSKGKIPTICFWQKRMEYAKIYVQKIINQQYEFSSKMEAMGKQVKILNIYDDCQMFINTQADDNNPANAAIKNTIRMGRSAGFNNIFAVQDINDFNINIYNGCKDFFIGYIRNFGTAPVMNEHKEIITANRKLFRERPLPNGYTSKHIAYLHIPPNDNEKHIFYPQAPLCGGY